MLTWLNFCWLLPNASCSDMKVQFILLLDHKDGDAGPLGLPCRRLCVLDACNTEFGWFICYYIWCSWPGLYPGRDCCTLPNEKRRIFQELQLVSALSNLQRAGSSTICLSVQFHLSDHCLFVMLAWHPCKKCNYGGVEFIVNLLVDFSLYRSAFSTWWYSEDLRLVDRKKGLVGDIGAAEQSWVCWFSWI